ncbi:MAG: helix-turn-helix transcriptional regulator [SAR202 cluster bacterium]|jgi:ArsR family transcriptional regulator|nr:helix-turn-helix transcriptional regulator [SAR202 cluster bacterium]|tara:strand:+ start:316 stop:687 length:372 start_codon:yes stop_codon:yes gene_type:complete
MTASDPQERLYELHASICKTFANPWRLRIVEALGDGECTVSQLVDALGIPKSNVSQHLGIMRDKGVVEYRREGGYVFYWLSNPKILTACRLMREVLMEQFERVGALSAIGSHASAETGRRQGA